MSSPEHAECEHFEERNSKFQNGILLLTQAYHMQNWNLLSNLEFECFHAQIRWTRNFIRFLFADKKWQRLQYFNFHQYQHIFAVARWNHLYGKGRQVSYEGAGALSTQARKSIDKHCETLCYKNLFWKL